MAERSPLKSAVAKVAQSARTRTCEVPAYRDGDHATGGAGTEHARSNVEDATLAQSVMAGQPWAQREVWYRFAPMVYALLRRTLGARHDPEDLLQEVFLRVFHRIGTLEKPEALRSFVYSIAIRVVSEELRRFRIRSRLASFFFGNAQEALVPHVDFESRDLLRRIEKSLERMNDRYRAVFVLRRFNGMELTEIASNLDVSVATVKRDLNMADKHIAKSVQGDEGLRAGFARSLAGATRERR